MPRLLALLLAVAAAFFAFAFSTASAEAAIRECGKTGDVRNITTRGVSCAKARGFSRAYIVTPGCTEDERCHLRRFRCTNRLVRGSIDARCTRGSQVVRFQHDYV